MITSERWNKIKSFITANQQYQRWCHASVCACMGAINCSGASEWKEMYPEEPKIEMQEFYRVLVFILREQITELKTTQDLPKRE